MRRLTPLLVLAITLLITANTWACPFCKDSIPSSDAQQAGGVPSGFNNTIYIMLVALVGMVGFVSFTLAKGARSSVNGQQAGRGFPLE